MFRNILLFLCCSIVVEFSAAPTFSHRGKVAIAENGKLFVQFKNCEGARYLKLNVLQYTNELGQSYSVSMFKYYISNIRLKKEDGKEVLFADSWLVNEDEPGSKNIILNKVPDANYTSVSFIIGVDSVHNCSGAQIGALDPVNGMFWAWNSGYIFLKMEGKAPASKSTANMLEFHIGGYQAPYNCIRNVILKFKNPVIVSDNINARLGIKADVNELFKTPVVVDFSKLSSVTDFHNSVMIANNYADMFSIE